MTSRKNLLNIYERHFYGPVENGFGPQSENKDFYQQLTDNVFYIFSSITDLEVLEIENSLWNEYKGKDVKIEGITGFFEYHEYLSKYTANVLKSITTLHLKGENKGLNNLYNLVNEGLQKLELSISKVDDFKPETPDGIRCYKLLKDVYYLKRQATEDILSQIISFIQPKTKNAKLKNVDQATISKNAIATFCELCNLSSLDKRGNNESLTIYCERICLKYDLAYSTRVRILFNDKRTNKQFEDRTKIVVNSILPLIPKSDSEAIINYLQSNRILYA